ncbi:MAG TPA: type III-B CRISPR module RAMP protein Cmr1 [Pseudomonadota bacterium]|nr:type III-B CRISPR module RAMP protein Cmr1 [Pseudomonadota bacterium]
MRIQSAKFCGFSTGDVMTDSHMELSLEFLTPGFVGGATPRQSDPYLPLRPSAVRGLLRTWFRMAVTAVFWPTGDNPSQQAELVSILREVENKVFGSTEHRSPLMVSMDEAPQTQPFPSPQSPTSGLRYLGYGLFERGTPTVLPVGKRCRLSLRIRPVGIDGKQRQQIEKLVSATVWLWTHLGGIGARSRRGFGSMELTRSTGLQAIDRALQSPCKNVTELEMQQRTGLNWALDVFEEQLGPEFYANPEDGRPHRAIRNLLGAELTVLPRTFPSGQDALEGVGTLFQQFRSTKARLAKNQPRLQDYFVVRNALQTGTPPNQSVGRTAFGLPLRFYFSSLAGQNCTILPPRGEGDQVPSPLHIRVHRLASGKFAVMLINLAADPRVSPLLDLDFLVMKTKQGTHQVPVPDTSYLRDFVRFAVAQAGGGGRS